MKNIMLMSTLWLSVLTTNVLAQGLAVKTGMNLSTYTGDDIDGSDNKTGFQFGLIYQFPINEKLSVEPGILYLRRGMKSEETETYEDIFQSPIEYKYLFDFTTHYLQVPIDFKYRLDPRIYFLAGPNLSFLLNNKLEWTNITCMGDNCTGSVEEDEFDDMRTMDLGVDLGLGIDVSSKISLDVTYQLGLLTLDQEGDSDAYSRSALFSIGYKF